MKEFAFGACLVLAYASSYKSCVQWGFTYGTMMRYYKNVTGLTSYERLMLKFIKSATCGMKQAFVTVTFSKSSMR